MTQLTGQAATTSWPTWWCCAYFDLYMEPTTRLRSPISVKVDDQFRLTICDFGSHRIQVYKKEAYEFAGPGSRSHARSSWDNRSTVTGAIGLVNPRVPWYNRQAR